MKTNCVTLMNLKQPSFKHRKISSKKAGKGRVRDDGTL